ncbi:MAG: hypothetical protein K8R36_00030 [Planctomycetales bacterium]|nr:hypothetical protein [Planctomycetales bacterium]
MFHIPRMVFLALFAVSFALAGCGGGTADKPAARTEKTVTPEQLLQGQWHGQMILDEETEKKLPPAQVAKLKAMTMGMEFQEGGKLILAGLKDDGKPYESEAAWEVVDAKDDQITIKSIEASGKATDAVLMFESDDSFLMPLKTEVANLGAMRFERLR